MRGKTRVRAAMVRMNKKAPSHLPTINSQSRTGAVSSSSMVPMRVSSETRRMVSAGMEKTSRKARLPVMGVLSGAVAGPPKACICMAWSIELRTTMAKMMPSTSMIMNMTT